MTRILRSVPIKAFINNVEEYRFNTTHFVPVLSTLVENMQVTLTTDIGEDVEFETGNP